MRHRLWPPQKERERAVCSDRLELLEGAVRQNNMDQSGKRGI